MTCDLPGRPNLTQLLEHTIEAVFEAMRVALPGVIQSVASDLSTASVLPAIRRSEASDADPVIPDVPLVFPTFGTGQIVWPIVAGDPCILVFADRSLEEWLQAGGDQAVEAGDPRTHDLTDAVALPFGLGGVPTGRAADISLRLTPSGGGTAELRLQSDGNIALGNSSRSGTYKKHDDSDANYSGESEVISLIVQALDVLLDKALPLVVSANGIVTPAKYDAIAPIRAKLNAIKGGL